MQEQGRRLYVKVEDEDQLINELEGIAKEIENVQETAELIEQLNQLKEESIEKLVDSVTGLEQRLQQIENDLPEQEQQTTAPRHGPNTNNQNTRNRLSTTSQQRENKNTGQKAPINDSMNELHSELENLKKELSGIN